MKPDLAVRMSLECFCCGTSSVITKHISRTYSTDLAHLVISKFFLCSRFENAHVVQRHRDSHISVMNRFRSHLEGQVGTTFAASVSYCKTYITVMFMKKFLYTVKLVVVYCLTSGSCCQKMGHVVILRNTAITHNRFNKHRNHRPAVWFVTHHLEVYILRINKRIHNQKFI